MEEIDRAFKKILGEVMHNLKSEMERPLVVDDGNCFVLHPRGMESFNYPILKELCSTQESLLKWILHLNGKNWVTTDHISCLILAFNSENDTDDSFCGIEE